MDILIAEDMGFCFGVKRAIKIARDIRRETDANVYTLGSIIHNPQVVQQLKEEGIVPIGSLDEVKEGYIVIRSHGVSLSVQKEIEERGFQVVDATCPLVKRVQKKARELVEEGYTVFVVGEKEHPEVQGIIGYTGGKVQVINLKNKVNFEGLEKVGVVAQTTQSIKNLESIMLKFLPGVKELKVFNTICDVTDRRQKEVIKLALKSELVIVIGGKKSANTSRLAALSLKEGCETHHIETDKEIKKEWFRDKEKVGIVSGSSTPDWIIERVINKLKKIDKQKEEVLHERRDKFHN
ncbi:4-hydroxy-3-methylbut-2-enyl diphosphate reductase [candidate division WOR-3 bacterium]|nr:4-hydroxy-3-methylbut-2-enyl diphosphate reductase [candidate division WOR-3 bacterium]